MYIYIYIFYVLLTSPRDEAGVILVVVGVGPTPVSLLSFQHLCQPEKKIYFLIKYLPIPKVLLFIYLFYIHCFTDDIPERQDGEVLIDAHTPHFSAPIHEYLANNPCIFIYYYISIDNRTHNI